MRIKCRTLFDCTHTGVTGVFKINQLPFADQAGKTISTYEEWNFARNQQRNLETIMQMVGLRAQPTITTYPKFAEGMWEFVFEVEGTGVYSSNGNIDDYGVLLLECNGIPMIVGLNEKIGLLPALMGTQGTQNIWFETVNI